MSKRNNVSVVCLGGSSCEVRSLKITVSIAEKKVFKYMHVFSYSYLYFDTHELPACQTHLSGSVLSITTVV